MVAWYKNQGTTIRAAIISGIFVVVTTIITLIFEALRPAQVVVVQIPTVEVYTTPTLTFLPTNTHIAPSPVVIQPPIREEMEICQEFIVIPFLKKITFAAYKYSRDDFIRLSYFDKYNVRHSLEKGIAYGNFDLESYSTFGSNERYVIMNPYPGTWTIEHNGCKGNQYSYEPEISFDRDLIYFVDSTHNPEDGTFIIYSAFVNDEYYLRPPENPDFDFQVLVKVTNPDKTMTSFQMDWNKERQFFITKTPVNFSQRGDYQIEVIVYLPKCDQESILTSGLIQTTCNGVEEFHHYSEPFSFPQ